MTIHVSLSRKFRPQTFKDVIGQTAIVRTLKNAIIQNKIPQVLLFAGPHGSGKTSLARIFAKAINCLEPLDNQEPCGLCRSCTEITRGEGLDVVELDGASNRGIEEMRTIKESVGYCTSYAKFQIYIIDEVHMLTKEAFNALLKTLEEPPPATRFFFATTEPQKLPQTILSRCQKLSLKKIKDQDIAEKLKNILDELLIEYEPLALDLIAERAKGALRDAESLLEQVVTFHSEKVTLESVEQAFGLVPKEFFFKLDKAVAKHASASAFSLAQEIFEAGISLPTYLELFTEHIRYLLMVKLSEHESRLMPLFDKYKESATFYKEEQLLYLLEMGLDWQQKKQLFSSEKVILDTLILKTIESIRYVSPKSLVERLESLKEHMEKTPETLVEKSVAQPPEAITKIDIPVKKKENMPLVTSSTRTETLLQFAAVEFEGKIQR